MKENTSAFKWIHCLLILYRLRVGILLETHVTIIFCNVWFLWNSFVHFMLFMLMFESLRSFLYFLCLIRDFIRDFRSFNVRPIHGWLLYVYWSEGECLELVLLLECILINWMATPFWFVKFALVNSCTSTFSCVRRYSSFSILYLLLVLVYV